MLRLLHAVLQSRCCLVVFLCEATCLVYVQHTAPPQYKITASNITPPPGLTTPKPLHMYAMTTGARGAARALRRAGVVQLEMRALQAQTSSYEYDVLVDVISGLLIGPLPEPQLMKRHVAPSPVDADDSLVELKAALRPSRQEMRSRQHTLAGLMRCAAALLAAAHTHLSPPPSRRYFCVLLRAYSVRSPYGP